MAGQKPSDDAAPVERHKLYEDAFAFVTGTLLVALGIQFYAEARLLTGGTAGLALLGQYASDYPFGLIFFLVNLPFYVLAAVRMGWDFTIRTFIAVAMVSVLSRLTPLWIDVGGIVQPYAAVAGGALIGVGLLILFRHKAGLGGFNILAVFLQDRYGWRAGLVLLAADLVVMFLALLLLDWQNVALSVIGAVVISMTLTINHRPGRYVGTS